MRPASCCAKPGLDAVILSSRQLSFYFVCLCSIELSRQLCCKCKFKNLNFGASLISLWKLRKQTIIFRKIYPNNNNNKKKIRPKSYLIPLCLVQICRRQKEVFSFYVSLRPSYINTAFSLKILKAYKRLQHRVSPFTELHWCSSTVKPAVLYSSVFNTHVTMDIKLQIHSDVL